MLAAEAAVVYACGTRAHDSHIADYYRALAHAARCSASGGVLTLGMDHPALGLLGAECPDPRVGRAPCALVTRPTVRGLP